MYINVSIVQHMHAKPMFPSLNSSQKKKNGFVWAHLSRKASYLSRLTSWRDLFLFTLYVYVCVCVCVWNLCGKESLHSTAKLKKHCLWVGAYTKTPKLVCTWVVLMKTFVFSFELNWIELKGSKSSHDESNKLMNWTELDVSINQHSKCCRVCHTFCPCHLHFKKVSYCKRRIMGNSNISPCKNIPIFKQSSKRNQNPSRYIITLL